MGTVLPFVISYRCSGDNLLKASKFLLFDHVALFMYIFSFYFLIDMPVRNWMVIAVIVKFLCSRFKCLCWEACQKKEGLPFNVKLTSLRLFFQGT